MKKKTAPPKYLIVDYLDDTIKECNTLQEVRTYIERTLGKYDVDDEEMDTDIKVYTFTHKHKVYAQSVRKIEIKLK